MPEENGEVTAEQMLAAATEYDNSVSAGEPEPQFELQQEPETEPDGSQEAEAEVSEGVEEVATEAQADAEPQSEGQDADEQVSSLTEGEAPEAKEQSPKSKWAKNEERKSRSWQEINAAKEELKREREKIKDLKKEIDLERAESTLASEYRDSKGFSASDYEKAAEKLESEGNESLAKEAKEKAQKVKDEADKMQAKVQAKKAEEDWLAAREKLINENPELADSESELFKTANSVLQDYPDLMYLPEGQGLKHAVQISKWKIGNSKAESSQAEVKELTEKLTKLEKKLSVNGGYTNEKVGGTRSFDELSDDEQSAALLQAALEHDNRGQ